MSGIASLGFGFFPRSVPIRYALALTGIALSIGTSFMLGIASARDGFVAASFFGIGIGGLLTLLPIAWADYYGRASYGAIRGIALSVQVPGTGIWPAAIRDPAGLVRQLRTVVAVLRRIILPEHRRSAAGSPAVTVEPKHCRLSAPSEEAAMSLTNAPDPAIRQAVVRAGSGQRSAPDCPAQGAGSQADGRDRRARLNDLRCRRDGIPRRHGRAVVREHWLRPS